MLLSIILIVIIVKNHVYLWIRLNCNLHPKVYDNFGFESLPLKLYKYQLITPLKFGIILFL